MISTHQSKPSARSSSTTSNIVISAPTVRKPLDMRRGTGRLTSVSEMARRTKIMLSSPEVKTRKASKFLWDSGGQRPGRSSRSHRLSTHHGTRLSPHPSSQQIETDMMPLATSSTAPVASRPSFECARSLRTKRETYRRTSV